MKKYISSTLFISIFVLCMPSFANMITLLDRPQADAKKIGSINSETGVVPIFTLKGGEWIKVGDPKNGNVGWIRASDLTVNNGTVGFTFTQQAFNSGNAPQGYVIQFGAPQSLSADQVQAYFKQLHIRQDAIQKDMQQMMQDMFSGQTTMQFPLVMPVLFMPQRSSVPASPTLPANSNTPTPALPATLQK